MNVVLITVGIFAIAMLIMAVGVLIKGRQCMRGTCGGPRVAAADGKIVCATCGREEQSGRITLTKIARQSPPSPRTKV